MTVATGIEKDGEEYAELIENSAKTHPLGRVGSTHDVVNAISFLAKDSSSFITGILLIVIRYFIYRSIINLNFDEKGALLPVDGGKSTVAPEL